MKKYLTLDDYSGSLGGLLLNPAGSHDVASPGGLASIQHHWSHGLFGPPERVVDAYAGTGDRYIYGEYGNMYTPNSHASLYDTYRGPTSDRTEYTNLVGEPYLWNNMMATSGLPHAYGHAEPSQGVNRQPVSAPSKSIENFQHDNSTTYTVIGDSSPADNNPKPTSISNGELIEPIESPPKLKGKAYVGDASEESKSKSKITAISIVLVTIVFVTLEFWAESIHSFTRQYLNKGAEITWVKYVIYALIATLILTLFVKLNNINSP